MLSLYRVFNCALTLPCINCMLCVRLQLKNESRKGGTATTMVDYRGRENGPMYERETRLVPPRAHSKDWAIPFLIVLINHI